MDGRAVDVALVAGSTAPTLRENASAREAERLNGVAANPLVRKIMTRFPGAQIVEVRNQDAAPAPETVATGDDEVAYVDALIVEDDV
jgi:DNA polymerase-3 subunit gamma/tau